MNSLKYKVGDKVWVEFVVLKEDIDDSYLPYFVESKCGSLGEWVKEESLCVPQPQTTAISVDDVQVGDVVTNQGKFYTVDVVMEDRVTIKEYHFGSGYLLKQDIEAIYRNVYTKKKCVEDMTREELLEYVKQLEMK